MAKIKTALISVSDKTGLIEFAKFLTKNKIKLLSTGGTAAALRKAKLKVTDVSDHTGFPEIMDGRVKTLHPKIHGGLLAKRNSAAHKKALKQHKIEMIDMAIVNLYPFEETVAKGADFAECIENIDIGGPSMIRSAAKNHEDVVVIVCPEDYPLLQEEMAKQKGSVGKTIRRQLAAKAFAKTAAYDAAISGWFAQQEEQDFPDTLTISAQRKSTLRYGENPHQKAAIYTSNITKHGIAHAKQIQGKELSYNNIADADAAYELVNEFASPAVAIIKHANPCGVATANNLSDAYDKALACDPVSAYGSIIAVNKKIDKHVAEKIGSLFVEVLIAPDADKAAIERFKRKKNMRLLLTGKTPTKSSFKDVRTISGGFLTQERDHLTVTTKDLKVVTKRKPNKTEIDDMLFAFRVCKHVKSNAIVITKGRSTMGIGAGQTSRVDSVRIAAEKAGALEGGNKGLTLASDAFFPFSDGVKMAAEAGVSCIIQPGGSIRDDEVIAMADKYGIAMVFTGVRHFKH